MTALIPHYQEFKEKAQQMTDEELIEAFNSEVGNKGWVSARATWLYIIREEFKDRGINYSVVSNDSDKGIFYAKHVKLVGKKLELQEVG